MSFLGSLPVPIFASVFFFNMLKDQSGILIDQFVHNVKEQSQIFRETLDYLPNGVLLINVNSKIISF